MELDHRIKLKWLAVYIAGTVLTSGVGSYLAYQSPLTSSYWTCWAGSHAWKRDMIRASTYGILVFFSLVQLNISPRTRTRYIWPFTPQRRIEYLLFGLMLVTPILVLPILIDSFIDGIPSHKSCDTFPLVTRNSPNYSRDILLPYLPYFVYIYSIGLGLIFPVLLLLVRCIRLDFARSKELIARLYVEIPQESPTDNQLTSQAFERLIVLYQSYVLWLTDVAERYIFLIIMISIGLLFEQFTPDHLTVTSASLDIGKFLLWLILGPSLITFVLLVAFGYQRTARQMQVGLGLIAQVLAENQQPAGLFDRIISTRNSLIWERSAAEFVVSVMKSAGVCMPLVIVLGGYIIDSLSKGDNWISVIIPSVLVNLIKSFYEQ